MSAATVKRPPSLSRPASAEPFPPVHFDVLHGRVIEAFEAKVPDTRGGGCTIDGYGRSWVNTTVRDELSVWLVDHQSGQQHKIDFGTDYLPMRYGHDVTLLWANGKLCTIANHTTHQLKHPAMSRLVLQEKKVGSILIPFAIMPFLAVVGGFFTFYFTGVAFSLFGAVSHHGELSVSFLLLVAFLTLLVTLTPTGAMLWRRAKNDGYNQRQLSYLDTKVQEAEDRWIRRYVPTQAVLR
jgi:hypothetical protein